MYALFRLAVVPTGVGVNRYALAPKGERICRPHGRGGEPFSVAK